MENILSVLRLGRLFAPCLVLTLIFAAAAGAQDETSGIPAGTAAQGSNPDNTAGNPDLVTIAADCTVGEGASVTLADGDGTEFRFVDGQQEIEITGDGGEVRIEGPNDALLSDHGQSLDPNDKSFDTDGDYTVASSTGLTCQGTGANQQTQADHQQGGSSAADKQYDRVIRGTVVRGNLPGTGGPSLLLLPWLVMLVGAGIVMLRRL